MDNINLDKVLAALDYVELDPNGDFDFIIKDYADEYIYLDFDDIDMRVQYKELFRETLKGHELTEEELELVANSSVGYLSRKIAARIDARYKANSDSEEREYRDYYGSRSAAFDHLFERYLGDFGYYNKVYEVARELYEQMQKAK